MRFAQRTSYARGIQSRPKAGKRFIGGREVPAQSAWEANWARYLEWQRKLGEICAWEYHPPLFPFPVTRGTTEYRPDFRVVTKAGGVEFHEVKGWKHPKGQTALRRMAKYYPSVTVIVVDAERYKAVAAQMRGIIQGWE